MRKETATNRLSRLLGSTALGVVLLLAVVLCFGCSSAGKAPVTVQDIGTSTGDSIAPDAVVMEATAVEPLAVSSTAMEPPEEPEAPRPPAPEPPVTEADLSPMSPLMLNGEGGASYAMLGRPPAAAPDGGGAGPALGRSGTREGPPAVSWDAVSVASLQATDSFSEPYILLDKYAGYYGAAGVVITQVHGTFVDPNEAWSRYQAGDLDVIVPPGEEIDNIQASSTYSPELGIFPDPATFYYGFSTDVEPLDDANLRAALSAAIDRERLISETLSGDEFPALTFAAPGTFGHVDGYAQGVGHPYSPTVAQNFLSGYTGQMTATLMFPADSSRDQAVAQAVRQMWIDTLGFTVTLESRPWPDYFELIQNGSAAERPGIFRMGWGADYPDAYSFLGSFRSGNPWNFARYNSSGFDGALDQAVTANLPTTRLSAYREAEQYLVMTDTAIAPLYYYPAYRMTVADVVREPSSRWGQHLDQWGFIGDGRPLRAGWGSLRTLDPALAYWATDLGYIEQLFLGLTDFDEEGNVSTELATGWDVSADGLVYTFTLRTDADWTDGSSVTAHDVEYGILRTLDPDTFIPDQPNYAYVLYVIENAQEYNNGNITDPEQVGVEALDDTHIVFTLTEPAAYFPSIVALPPAYPQPEGAIAAHGDAWTDPGNIVTNGPFQLSEWVQAPAVRIEKEAFASPGEGGTQLFHITYWNDGGEIAPDVVISDTLEGMTYITDSTGLTHTGTGIPGDPLVWNLGDLAPSSQGELFLLVSVDVSAGERVTNTAQIETANPYDTGDQKEWMWSDEVVPNDTHLWVNKWAWTGDPAPGYTSTHQIEVCNEGSTWSNEVVLTDTLHPSFTLQTWWAEPPFWTEVSSSDHELVLQNSTMGSWNCQYVYLRVLLDEDAWRDMTVTDTVRIASSNDIESDDNEYTWWGNVQPPYTNLSVEKGFAFGQTIPGGGVGYGIGYGNNGNTPITGTVRLTDTLPVSTSYNSAFRWGPEGGEPFTPTLVTDDYVVWELDGLENGFWDHINLVLDIDAGVPTGTVLLNSAEITEIPYERSYVDNVSQWSETVNDPGPNLRVTKSHEWWNDGQQLFYRINVANVGTETVSSVLVTDTYPMSTTFGNWWHEYWMNVDFFTTTTSVGWELEQLEPGWSTWFYLAVDVDNPGEPLHTYTNTVEIMTLPGEVELADNVYQDVAFSGGEVQHVDLRVYGNDLWGCAYSDPITVTTAQEERYYYGDSCWGDGFNDPFLPGDTVTVAAGTGQMPVIFTVPDPFIANASSITDTVWGQIDSLDHEPVEISLYDFIDLERQTDASGNFSALFPDIPRAGRGEVRYRTTVNYAQVTFHREFQTPDLVFTVDYDDEWVNGNYEPGHTVWLTLTESDSATVKATAVLTTGPIPDWGGQSGFQANWEDWSPPGPDIAPGDWVFGLLHSNVYTTAVRVGTIDSGVDTAADLVTGTLHAPWLVPALVTVRCEIHEENGQGIEVYDVDPDGGTFTCDFSGGDSLYDIVPGTNVVINYLDPSGNWVQMHPDNPAPYLRIEKGSDGTPGQGGNMSFRIRYRNDGGMAASDVVITDVLEGMTYLTDTLHVAPSGSGTWGDPLIWNLGTVDPSDDWIEFTLFAQVDEVAGNPVTNTAQIATSSPWDQGEPWEKVAGWSGTVWDNATSMWINKNTWTENPVPDTDFVYSVEACNGGENNTNSSWTTVTDTLPVSTTLLTWQSDDPGWVELQREPHLLVLQRPTVDAHQCSRVNIWVHLTDTVSAGDWLCNNASIYAIDDISGTHTTEYCHQVGEPNANLYISKWWAGGQLVPGGTFYYHAGFQNDGNVPVYDVTITETIPADTTLFEVRVYDYNWNFVEEITPTFVAPNQYTWTVLTATNGTNINYQMAFEIDADAEPGTVLTNTIAVSPAPDEGYLEDNVHTEVEQVFDHGPNLRVRKQGYWHDWGSDTRQIEYNINIENVGDETVSDVFLTDTYPEGLYMEGDFGIDYWGWWDKGYDPASGVFTVALESLNGGAGVGFNTYFITDTSPLPFGMRFTNTVEVAPSDPYPDDNTAQFVLGTGPDLWVEKEWVAGDVGSGELITFSLAFGNQADIGWWSMRGNAWLTDTLPDAMTFVTSTLRWCGGTEWCGVTPTEVGNDLAWELWPIENRNSNEILLTAQFTDTVTGFETYTNRVEIASAEPLTDVEAFYDNNAASAVVVDVYDIYLPLVLRE